MAWQLWQRTDVFGACQPRDESGMARSADSRSCSTISVSAPCVVSFAGVTNGYGNVVEVDHGNGYSTLYGHNSRLIVRVGNENTPVPTPAKDDRSTKRPAAR